MSQRNPVRLRSKPVARRVEVEFVEKIETIRQRFSKEWLLIEVVAQNEMNVPLKGQLVFHTPSKGEAYQELLKSQKHLYILYSDEIPEDYEALW